MTYDVLFTYLRSVFDYLLELFRRFLAEVSESPLVMTGIFVLVSVPAVVLVFDFIFDFVYSSSDIGISGIGVYKSFKSKINKKKEKEERQRHWQARRDSANEIAQTFFVNNPDKYSVWVDGFNFQRADFQNKHWSNYSRSKKPDNTHNSNNFSDDSPSYDMSAFLKKALHPKYHSND